MRRHRFRLLVLAAASLATARCAEPAPDTRAVERELLAADSAFARETAEGGAAAWTARFEVDGAMVRAAGDIRGHDAIRAAMEPALTDATDFTWAPDRAIAGTGDMGITIGSYRIADAATGDLLGEGRYLTVWRRQDDGSWKVVADLGDEAEAPAEAPPDEG